MLLASSSGWLQDVFLSCPGQKEAATSENLRVASISHEGSAPFARLCQYPVPPSPFMSGAGFQKARLHGQHPFLCEVAQDCFPGLLAELLQKVRVVQSLVQGEGKVPCRLFFQKKDVSPIPQKG